MVQLDGLPRFPRLDPSLTVRSSSRRPSTRFLSAAHLWITLYRREVDTGDCDWAKSVKASTARLNWPSSQRWITAWAVAGAAATWCDNRGWGVGGVGPPIRWSKTASCASTQPGLHERLPASAMLLSDEYALLMVLSSLFLVHST